MPNVFSMKFEEVDDRACQSDRFRLLCLEFVTISLEGILHVLFAEGSDLELGFVPLFFLDKKGSSRESKHLSAVVGENLDDDRFWFSRGAQNRPANENLKPDLQEVELFVLLFFFVLLDVFQSIHHFDSGVWIAVDFFVSLFQKGALDNTILQRLAVLFGFCRPHWHHCSFCCTVKAVWTSDLRTFSKSCAGEIELLWSVVFEIACSFVLKSKQNWVIW